LAEITDDRDLTLLVIEVDAGHAVHWMSPQDASEELAASIGESKGLSHPGGTQALFVSGQIRFLPKSIKPAVLRAAISIAGDDDKVASAAH
jgi:hypothetical protein